MLLGSGMLCPAEVIVSDLGVVQDYGVLVIDELETFITSLSCDWRCAF